MGLGITDYIGRWVAGLTPESVPRRVIEELKNQVLSCIAAIHAGHFSEAGRVVSRTVRQWSGGKEATLIPSGERTSLHFALYANSALSLALDYDDYLFAAHTGHSAVVGALGVAEAANKSGSDLLLAQLAANEVAGRLGAVALGGALNGQMCTFVHLASGAALAARLLDLDSTKTAAALNIAFAQPPQPSRAAFFGSEAKAVLAAQTLTIGVQAAQLALQGMRVVADVWEGEDGFAKLFAVHPLAEAFRNLGELWVSDTLSYKTYPGCAYLAAIIDCVLALQRQHHIDGRKVRSVEVSANPLTLGMEALSQPYLRGPESLPVTLNFSVPYNVAAALLDKELSPRQFLPERIKDPATWELAARVRLTLDDGMTQKMQETALVRLDSTGRSSLPMRIDWGPRQLLTQKMSFGARVRIELESGKTYEAEQEVPFGAFGRTFDDRRKQVEDKFRRETRYTLRKERMEQAIDMIFHLEDLNAAQVRELVRLCCSERS